VKYRWRVNITYHWTTVVSTDPAEIGRNGTETQSILVRREYKYPWAAQMALGRLKRKFGRHATFTLEPMCAVAEQANATL
jgi:hypothetical protein